MNSRRSSGILLHPTCLPSRFGIGDLGPEAYRFVDFLTRAGQCLWQILPLGPTSYGNSPYMCFSAFAGNPLLISPEKLVEDGLLEASEIADVPAFPSDRVDYGPVIDFKTALLKKAFERFRPRLLSAPPEEFHQFCQQRFAWLEDFALFMALKDIHQKRVWPDWDKGAASRNPDALMTWRNTLNEEIQFHKFVQHVFFRQWQSLKRYCHQKGIRIIGDIPIYVAHDSADVWANRELFYLDEMGHPLVVAGVPPDYFSLTGQRWGNPVYRWEVMAQSGFRWWIERFGLNLQLVDILRVDHFRGFEAYWEIPAAEPTAVVGRWVKGPEAALLDAVKSALGDIQIIAEDLGVITPEVDNLRDRFGFPGMRILQMAFGNDPKASDYRPHNHIPHCVVYTGTHDHNTTVGWFTANPGTQTAQSADDVAIEREHLLEYIGSDGSEIAWEMIRMAMGSVARTVIFPLQDVLSLGSEARMNLPGTATGNWEWRLTPDMITPEITDKLHRLTAVYERQRQDHE